MYQQIKVSVALLGVIVGLLGASTIAQAVELRVTTPLDLVNCASGVALTAGPDAGRTSAPGDTCVLDPGAYPLAVVVTLSDLTLRSRDGKFVTNVTGGVVVAAAVNGVTIGGSGESQGVTISGGPGLVVLSTENFTLQNSDVLGSGGPGILVATGGSVRNFEFLNLTVRGNAGPGLAFTNGSSVSNVTVDDSTFESNGGNHLHFANGGAVSGLGVRGVTLRTAGGGGSGIAFLAPVTDVSDSDVSNSTIEGNSAFGVNFANGGRVQEFAFSDVACNGNIFGNANFANFGEVAGVMVESSTFNRSSTGFGMGFVNGGGVEDLDVRGSEFDQNATVGFGVGLLPDDFANSSFTDNRFRNNALHGFVALMGINSINDLDFSGNEFTQNTLTGAFMFTTMGDIAGINFDGDQFTKNGTLGLDVNTGFGPTPGAGDIGEFTFSGVTASENGTLPGTGIRLMSLTDGDVTNIEVANTNVNNNGGFGMQLTSAGLGGATPGEVSNVEISNSHFDFNGTRAAAGLGSGAMLGGRSIDQIMMTQTSASSNNDHGLDLFGTDSASNIVVNGGTYSSNDRNVDSIGNGVHVNTGSSGTANDVLVENISADANDSGIVISVQGRNGSDLTIQNNPQVNQNRHIGIGVLAAEDLNDVLITGNGVEGNEFNIHVSATADGNNIVVSDNQLVGASGTGVMSDATGVTVNSNDIRSHDVGIKVKKADNVHISNNNIVQNDQFGVDGNGLGPGVRVDAKGNWWGEPSGPSGAGPGIGDAVSSNVDFQPFLSEPAVATGANFQISNVTAPSHVDAGQAANIQVTVTNVGSEEGTQEIKIRVLAFGGVVAQQDVRSTTLNPSASTDVSFQVSLPEGSYTIEVSTNNDTVTQALTVGSGGSTPPPSGGSNAEALDANGNNRLDDAEILNAIVLWISGTPVPGTGRTITDAEIRTLIQMWISGAPIR